MKQIVLVFIMSLLTANVSAQNEGQDFCTGNSSGNYFPLTINKKKIVWYNTYYFEELVGEKKFDNTSYSEYRQTWEDSSIQTLYLRDDGNNRILQYEKCCNVETVRYDKSFTVGSSWKSADKTAKYTLISLDAEFKTPYCFYKNLMAIKAEFEKITFIFYYQKGYGYVGATTNDKIISYASPKW